MKLIKALLLCLLLPSLALAQSDRNLVAVGFTPQQATALLQVFGSAVSQSLIPATNNAIDLGSSSKAFRTGYFGTSLVMTPSGASARIGQSTTDGTDDKQLSISATGASSNTRGSYINFAGNESAGGGELALVAGNAGGGRISLFTSAYPVEILNNSLLRWSFTSTGNLTQDATNGGNIVLSKPASEITLSGTGSTIAFQEATAGSACSGTLTANGATPVVTSTTCAATGARIFLQRTSSETGSVNAWISAISNGVSFSVTSEAADTGTYNWVIFKEAA